MALKERPCELRLALILFACLHLAGAQIVAGTETTVLLGKELDIEVSNQLGFESAEKPTFLSDASDSSTTVASSKSRDQLRELFLKFDRALQFDGKVSSPKSRCILTLLSSFISQICRSSNLHHYNCAYHCYGLHYLRCPSKNSSTEHNIT
jgi:hypothetical protein